MISLLALCLVQLAAGSGSAFHDDPPRRAGELAPLYSAHNGECVPDEYLVMFNDKVSAPHPKSPVATQASVNERSELGLVARSQDDMKCHSNTYCSLSDVCLLV